MRTFLIFPVLLIFLLQLALVPAFSVTITIDAAAGRQPVSPYIYGKNNELSDSPGSPLSKAEWQLLRDSGLNILRENGGNNSTKYNWRRKLTSHPDWYNNVYAHDWDFAAQSLQDNLPGVQGVWALQLIGWAAASNRNNFNDWDYNGSQWWEGVNSNWAGGGGPEAGDGDPSLYLEEWPADSTSGILQHWFGADGLGLDGKAILYWNMDNEPEVWNGTHDDVYPEAPPVEEYLQKYFAVAKKVRVLFPGIKLMGPVSTNEWQWYNWDNDKVKQGSTSHVWLEYFIKRVAEEQQASGLRLLDVIDLHFYPGESKSADILQLHRIWFDKNYNYPGANGVKRSGPGGWDNALTKEYIFARCRTWLEKYCGPGHGVGLGITEMGIKGEDPNVTAVWYASTLGVFADEGVEIFTPWTWKTGMWEVLHLFSRYTHGTRIQATSDANDMISAYATLNASLDSMTVMLVNRSLDQSSDVSLHPSHFTVADGAYPSLSLSDLPAGETFKSHSDNALQHASVTADQGILALSLPALSVTAVLLTGQAEVTVVRDKMPAHWDVALEVYPNPFNPTTTFAYTVSQAAHVTVEIFNAMGRHVQTVADAPHNPGSYRIQFDGSRLASGIYFVRLSGTNQVVLKKVMLVR